MCAVTQHVLEVFKLGSRIQMRRITAPTVSAGVIDLFCAWITTKKVVGKPVRCLNPPIPKELSVAMAASAELP